MDAILIVILIGLIIYWIQYKKKLLIKINSLNNNLKDSELEIKSLNIKIDNLILKNNELIKYEGLIDIERKANEIILNADKIANEIKENAEIEMQLVKTRAIELKEKAEYLLESANIKSIEIINSANKKAEEIAGDAYKAMQDSKQFEKIAKAMKNIIEGYGNQYLFPTYSLLDDLAEEFGYEDAGKKLKIARENTRILIDKLKAAKCDYVESNRRETAIRFVLDAFNGKVDSILSKVKKDNYGILEQKIKDSFHVVNNNGIAFRNAVITEVYLQSRLEELKWAVIVIELKMKEQEEQRRIKEQIREEEKARREFEKAIKDAQKEEEALKSLIEKAQSEIKQASESQKEKYEQKLKELEDKLKLAEEKNIRAISMAQQTKSGNIYVISNIGSFGEDVYKIGMTRRLEPLDRIKELGDASVPFEFDIHTMIYSDNAPKLEHELHKRFLSLQLNKVNPRKEFFRINLLEIKNVIEKMNIQVKWTMTAEAKQYRESLAIEESISKDNSKRIEWEKSQMKIENIIIDEEVIDN